MNKLHLTIQPAIGPAKARKLGSFLGQYEISTRGLRVFQCVGEGHCEPDNAAAETIKQTASTVGASIVAAPVTAPIAIPVTYVLTIIFGQWLLPILLAMLAGNIGGLHWMNRRYGKMVTNPETGREEFPEYTIVEFAFSDVSARRRRWAEYLLALWAVNNSARISGLHYPAVQAEAEQAIARHGAGYFPRPWKDQPRRARKRTRTRKRARRQARQFFRF